MIHQITQNVDTYLYVNVSFRCDHLIMTPSCYESYSYDNQDFQDLIYQISFNSIRNWFHLRFNACIRHPKQPKANLSNPGLVYSIAPQGILASIASLRAPMVEPVQCAIQPIRGAPISLAVRFCKKGEFPSSSIEE